MSSPTMAGFRLATMASSTSMRRPPRVNRKLSPVTPMSVSMNTRTHPIRSLLTPLALRVGRASGSSTMTVLRSVTRIALLSPIAAAARGVLWLRFVDRRVFGENDPGLRATRPEVQGGLDPRRVVECSGPHDALFGGSQSVQLRAAADPDAAFRANPTIADCAAAQDAWDRARRPCEVEGLSRYDNAHRERRASHG